jgi:hypothetical protein
MMLFVECVVPFIVVVAVYIAKYWLDVSRPAPRALGSILPKLCVVSSDEIQLYCGLHEEEPAANHLQGELRRSQICVVWGYLRQMAWNTKLFQQALRFEKMKIDPAKSSLDYEPRETLVLELVDEAAARRWLLVKAQMSMAARALLGLNVTQKALKALLAQYKHLEQEIVTLTSMAQDDCYYTMLVERLGLTNWGLQ